MPSFVKLLYLLSTGLLVPVILLLLLFVVWTLLECGGFLREMWDRRRGKTARQTLRQKSESTDEGVFEGHGVTGLPGMFVKRVRGLEPGASRFKAALADTEVSAARRLGRMRLLFRIGPMLGLMGTLIPLGPALIGLSDGNVRAMAENLVVAFSTTVLGLLVGGLAFAIWQIRRQWYAEDLVDIELVVLNFTGATPERTSVDER